MAVANPVRLLHLADRIEKMPHYRLEEGDTDSQITEASEGFNMSHWGAPNEYPNHCGTVACIGGWAVYLFHDSPLSILNPASDPWNLGYDEMLKIIADLLEISTDEAYTLCLAYADDHITPSIATAVIREFVETGEINWEKHLDNSTT